MTRSLLRRRLAGPAVALLALVACATPTEPTALADIRIHAHVGSSGVVALVVEVTAADIPAPLVFNISVVEGEASGTISIPAGSDRTITVRAFNRDGIETHRGSVTVDVRPGDNPSVPIVLLPLTGDVPIVVTIGHVVVTVDPAEATIFVGDTIRFTATVTDGDGNPLDLLVRWASTNPVATLPMPDGGFLGNLPGEVEIVAIAGAARGSATLRVVAREPVTYTLRFERDHLDLETGTVHDCQLGSPCPSGWDIQIAFNSDRDIHSVVFQSSGTEIAHLRGSMFEEVGPDDVASAEFTTSLIDEPFDDTRVILIRTQSGAVFKLGNPVESVETFTVTFQATLLIAQ